MKKVVVRNRRIAVVKSLRIGRIQYLNTDPFFDNVSSASLDIVSSTPRALGRMAMKGQVDAGALSLVDLWRLRRRFEPLGRLGIAVKRKVRSVLLFSKKPLAELGGRPIGVTDQTSTSVCLLRVILEKRYHQPANLRVGFHPGDTARLLIGDAAMTANDRGMRGFSFVIDLGEEWYKWQKLPFVFARWAVRKNVPVSQKRELLSLLENALKRNEKHWTQLSSVGARRLKLAITTVRRYYSGFRYRFGKDEIRASKKFLSLLGSTR